VLLVLLALLGGGVAQHFFAETPGHVLIVFGENSYLMSLILFFIVLFITMVSLYALIHLVRRTLAAPGGFMRWRGARRVAKGDKALQQGLTALAEGRWLEAEKMLTQGARLSDKPMLHYLGAARAAEALLLPERSEMYLGLAEEVDQQAAIAVGLARAERLLQAGNYKEARQVLAGLRKHKPKNPEVLRLQLKLCAQVEAWRELLDTLPPARRVKAVNTSAANALQRAAYVGLLSEVNAGHQHPDPKIIWNEIPVDFRQEPELARLHAQNLLVAGRAADAEAFVRKQLKRAWQPALLSIYADIALDDDGLQLKHAQKWLQTHEDSPALLKALGRLCLRAKLWGKARSHFERALEAAPDPELYHLLADTLTEMDETEVSARYRREGLSLATLGSQVTLLPAPQ